MARGLAIPANTAAALWVVKYALQPLRADGRAVSDAIPIQVEAFYSSQYPPVEDAGAEVQVLSLNGLTSDLDPARIRPAARVRAAERVLHLPLRRGR